MQTAQVQQFHVGGEVYEGANPQYHQGYKITKGVPWRRISETSRAEKRMNRRPKHGYGHAGAPIERSVAT